MDSLPNKQAQAPYGSTGIPPGYPQGGPPYQGASPYQQGAPPYQQGAPPYQQGGAPYPGASNVGPELSTYPPPGSQGYQGDQDAKDHPDPSCPPLADMDNVPGFGSVGFDAVLLPPPPYEEVVGERPEQEIFKSSIGISEENAREAMLEHVRQNCCWGEGPARAMVIQDLISSNAYRYTLESFCESRTTKWTSEPFTGGNVVITGHPPGPWDIPATPPQMFKSTKLDMEVPNTASVKPCFKCNGMGSKSCNFCFGTGRQRCHSCGGSGSRQVWSDGEYRLESCGCMGGQTWCSACNGTGKKQCSKCHGRCNLRWYICLTIKWTNHLEDHVEQRTHLADSFIKDARGDIVFEEVYPRVWPLNTFPLAKINERSHAIVASHSTKFTMERILMQRQRVHCVPVSEVQYTYKSEPGTYFVYGLDHKVEAPDYPAKCCCGCSVL